jgi:hypothetical protein
VGDEEIAFEAPVPLEGKVESYLQLILTEQVRTLAQHLARSSKRYPSQMRVGTEVHAAVVGPGVGP